MINWCFIGELCRRDGGDGYAVVFDDHHAISSHLSHLGPGQVPLVENPFDLLLATLVDDDEHPLLRLAQQNFVRRHVGGALWHLGQVDLDAGTPASRRLAARAGEPRRAHVLYTGDRTGGEQLEAGLHAEFLHERIAHLHRAALLLGRFLGQILRRKRRPCQAVAPRRRADIKDRIADSLGRAPCHLAVP